MQRVSLAIAIAIVIAACASATPPKRILPAAPASWGDHDYDLTSGHGSWYLRGRLRGGSGTLSSGHIDGGRHDRDYRLAGTTLADLDGDGTLEAIVELAPADDEDEARWIAIYAQRDAAPALVGSLRFTREQIASVGVGAILLRKGRCVELWAVAPPIDYGDKKLLELAKADEKCAPSEEELCPVACPPAGAIQRGVVQVCPEGPTFIGASTAWSQADVIRAVQRDGSKRFELVVDLEMFSRGADRVAEVVRWLRAAGVTDFARSTRIGEGCRRCCDHPRPR